ncbi:HAD family hydrolase [Pseudoalteromonas ardens]|uniref:Haloacid dehalogenase n=1 Tax=Pseudoalteromonas rubra TaxID=43658 RepID=A0A0L0ELZ7_9GAMM|nr:HAD-IA family hydrolase [Pseudoalteromonas sp. R96]KNC65487.1 haloacid dehalogenase [Pseudoalteromonas rubra]MDK1310948.1 HAD-IA family hydrolase [Pseudoalteromonas sp. R96]
MTQAVIFDLDGTLLNTSDDLGAALNHVLQQHEMAEVPRTVYSPAISNGVKALLEVGFGEQLSKFDFSALKQQLLDYYEQHIAVHSRCFEGIEALLQALQSREIKIAIMTNKPTFLTLPLLAQIGPLKGIEVVVCGDTLEVAKPHPEPLLLAAKQLGVDPTRCTYIGDAERDIAAAKAAGMRSAAALWGFIPSLEEAQSWSADLNLTNPESLISYI